MKKIVLAYHTHAAGVAIYIAIGPNEEWDGTEEGADKFPQVEVGHDADGYEDMSKAEIVEAFKARGIEAEF